MNTIKNRELKKRIIEVSYKHKLSHLGSCLSAVDIMDEIYQKKKIDEKFVLSEGHAAVALYAINEKYFGINADAAFIHHGVHPDRCKICRIDCSSGSLGHGFPIALGMALSNRQKNVYCLISDGECTEGSTWEALRIKSDQAVVNLKVYLNLNGWGAYDAINKEKLVKRIKAFDSSINICSTTVEQLPFLKGQSAHYYIMKEEDYHLALRILK